MRQAKSYCRMCFGFCGVNVALDDDERVVEVRGDHDNPASLGYACIKGLESPALHNSPTRLLHALKRIGNTHVRIELEQALDEIADKMREIAAEDGLQSLAFYRGTGAFGSTIMVHAFPALAQAIGGQMFSSMTIDQSAKWVAMDRLGTWAAGKDPFERSDVWLFAGMNPLVSVFSWNTPVQNPMKRLKEARARGIKLIVVDPRVCEIAKFADIHLQIYPGEDAAVAACLIHIVLANAWQDTAFCAQHVQGLEQLRAAVARFTPEYVATRAGVTAEQLIAAADLFARQSRRGSVSTGTGADMAAHANVTEHLYECLGIICGRFMREGEALPNPGVLVSGAPKLAQVKVPTRGFEKQPKSRVRGAARLMGQSATPTLPEEILTPGPGRVRSLIVAGGNPVAAIPDSNKVIEAFRALDLLVTIDPMMTATAQLAHYVLPAKMMFEHADVTYSLEMTNLSYPYSQYTPAIVPPPPGSQLCDEGYVCWALAKRMGKQLQFTGVDLNMEVPPSDDELLGILARNGGVSFAEIKQTAQGGRLFDLPPKYVQSPTQDASQFDVMPDDVAAELRTVLNTDHSTHDEFTFRLIGRRMREVCNTAYRDLPTARMRTPFNPLCVHPEDLTQLGIRDGERVDVISDNGRIPAIVKADATLKRGVVSMTHGFGGMPNEQADYNEKGSNTAMLISLDRDCEPLQAMPRMTGIPVRVERAAAVGRVSIRLRSDIGLKPDLQVRPTGM